MKECETVIQKALQEGRFSLLIPESQQICKLHHIPTPVSYVVQNVDEAITKGKLIGFPACAPTPRTIIQELLTV